MRTFLLASAVVFLSAVCAQRGRSGAPRGFSKYRSWNSKLYPVWDDGDSRYRDCWRGGNVSLEVRNDGPTLIGAKATFTIQLRFPGNQTVLPDGQVVWAHNCTVNGTHFREGEPVYGNDTLEDWDGVFPDGTPMRTSGRKSKFVFVWKVWGKFWQVADGPSSSLAVVTDSVPLGSYSMEVVVYHSRGRDQFIPMGTATTDFAITDQIPFSVSLSQVNDLNQADQSFIQNRAVSFTVRLHDPSQYLSGSDITFNWDFGDNSGTLISRGLAVTHTYLTAGFFQPLVILQATIPAAGCVTPGDPPTPGAPTGSTGLVSSEPAPQSLGTTVSSASVAPVVVSTPGPAQTSNPADLDLAVPGSAAAPAAGEDTIALEASVAPADTAVETVAPAAGGDTVAEAIASVAPVDAVDTVPPVEAVETVAPDTVALAASVAPVEAVDPVNTVTLVEAVADTVAPGVAQVSTPVSSVEEIIDAVTLESADLVADPTMVAVEAGTMTAVAVEAGTVAVEAGTMTAVEAGTVAVEAGTMTAVAVEAGTVAVEAGTMTAVEAGTVAVEAGTVAVEAGMMTAVAVEAGTEAAEVPLIVAKRQAPAAAEESCLIYRYGSFSTGIDIIQGIESVEIVQVQNVEMELEALQNAVDLTITCQGSLPSEVCTVISDADCAVPVLTVCNAVQPSPECQLILRQVFNETGVFCVNVSMTNSVSLAMTSTRVNINAASGSSMAATVVLIVGMLLVASAVGAVVFTCRRLKDYRPLNEDPTGSVQTGWASERTSVQIFLRSMFTRQPVGENSPLLQGRVV
ncbi:melanocyte protein PMEL-like isoform X1 [Acipenser ruthenus]|uniref:melanocyte protein PMEL-like isoform X1 n=1 Tax=Acipenser ruthenus TaxID=7906 RepID=UPI0027415C56|nr:melanocyte protein PMEL-like isoform X1 [Acipenser ruthenus]